MLQGAATSLELDSFLISSISRHVKKIKSGKPPHALQKLQVFLALSPRCTYNYEFSPANLAPQTLPVTDGNRSGAAHRCAPAGKLRSRALIWNGHQTQRTQICTERRRPPQTAQHYYAATKHMQHHVHYRFCPTNVARR